MSEELRPCPFCGGEASGDGHANYNRPLDDVAWADGSPITEAFFVNCIKCGIDNGRPGLVGGYQTREQAIAAWNARTPPPAVGDGEVTQEDREAAASLCISPTVAAILRDGKDDNHAFAQAFARHRRASALGGVGEAERAVKEAAEPWADYHGDLPDYDHPMRPVYESGIQYAVELLAKMLGVEDYTPCDGTEDFDGDLGGTLMNIVLEAMPKDEHGDPIYPRDLAATLETQAAEIEGLRAELTRRERNENRNCINWGPCSQHDGFMAEGLTSLPAPPAPGMGEGCDPDLGKIERGHVCKHGVRWPHACQPCDDAAWEARTATKEPTP